MPVIIEPPDPDDPLPPPVQRLAWFFGIAIAAALAVAAVAYVMKALLR